jgi:predicted ATP-grasp superfamily ATP-dependent carboligase
MQSVLVTDGEQRSALAITRSLGSAGYAVYVCSSRKQSLAGASRFASADITVPDALAAPTEFAMALEAVLTERDIDVLVPVTEAAMLAALPARGSFPNVAIPFPDLDTFRRVSDKAAVMDAALSVGVSIPRQTTLGEQKEREILDQAALDFPLVLKPARSVAEQEGKRSKWGVRHAADWNELNLHLDQLPPVAYPLLLQQRIVGPGVGIFLLVWEGEIIASFAHRRLREKPPAGGVSVYRESITADPQLVKRSAALLERFGWQGVAMVEYKVEAESETPYLMEINGRFWGSLQLATDAGVDFPGLLLQCATGETPQPVHSYRSGIRSRWWWGEVDHLLARLRRSAEWLALPPNSPSRWQSVGEFLKLWRPGDRYEVLRLRDLRPFLRETIDWFHGR